MAFSVNHMKTSLLAARELNLGQTALADAVQRLSSGLRINRAADDASGLGISEQIRSQAVGLGQSARNANAAISMVQLTDSSLTQVGEMLLRMKTLAVEGRNGGLSLSQRKAISDELVQLRDEINQLAERTTFNSNALLKNALGAGSVSSFFDRTQLSEGASILNGLTVENLDVFSANVGDYSVSFSTPTAITNQKSRATTKLLGTEGAENSQAATVTGSGTAEAVLTLSGIFEPGDQIRFTVKGDNPDRTLVQTYTVTAENLTANNDGLSAVISGSSGQAYTNIASAMASQFNAANALTSGDVDADNKFTKPNAVAAGGTVRFFGSYLGTPLAAVTVGAQTFNRQDQSRTIIPTIEDLGEGNRITLTVNGKSYGYVVASDSTTETIAEGLRQQLLRDYPSTAVRAGSILTVESDSGLTVAELGYRVHRPLDANSASHLASSVSAVASNTNAGRQITINDFDVIAGRRFSIAVGNPEEHVSFSLIAGTDDTRQTVAAKLAQRLGVFYGSGASAVSASNGTIQFASALGMGMSNIRLSVNDTVAGAENPKVRPAQGITAAVWGVGGRLDDGFYDILYNDTGLPPTNPAAWTFLSSAVPGSASFNGSVLTTSPGNAVNVTLTGTPKPGDRITFRIGPAEFGIGEPDATVTQANGQIFNSTRAVTGAGDLTGINANYTVTYLGGTSWNVTGEPSGVTAYYDQASNTLRLDTTRSVSWATSYSYSGDNVSFASGENYSDISVTRTRAAGTSGISGSAYDLWGGDYQAYFNGSHWALVSGGPAGTYIDASTNIMHTPGKNSVQLFFGGTQKEGDRVNFRAHDTGAGSNDYVSFLSSSNDFATQTRTMSGVPLETGNYSYTFNGWSWNPQAGTPAGSMWGSSNSSSIASISTKSLQIFRYQGSDDPSPSATRNPMAGDYMTVSVSGATQTAAYERPEGVTNTTFAVVGGLPAGDYVLEYNGATGVGAFNYTIKNAFGDSVLAATYASGWLTLDTGDQVELKLTGTPKVGDRVFFTVTPGNVITDRLVEGSNIGGLETSVSSQHRDRSDRVITIQQDDLAFGRSVEVALGGREYAVRVESTDTAATVASRLAGLIAQDYPNNTSANDSRELPAATRVTVLNNQITLQEPAKQGIDDISVTVRNIANPGVITLTAQANTGLIGKSQSLAIGEIASGGSKTFHFDDFGISFALKNSRLVSANEESFSAYVSPITTLAVGTLRQAATVQLGAGATSREQTVISGFKDVRINGENRNVGSEKVSFDNLSAAVKSIQATTEEALSAANFGTVENFIQAVIDRVSAYRTGLGAQQSRLESSIAGLENVSENLLEMNSRIMNSDQAADMARLTRIQIGQKAASAMLAQGNVLPGVILSMLKPQAAIRAGASPL